MQEEEMRLIGQLIAEVLEDVTDEARQRRVRDKVRELCQQFPLYTERLRP
jgi:glycine/serine hydroxymethyltransferase